MIHATTLLFISGGEIGFILLIVVMVFGADKIPEIARGLGKGIKQVKNATILNMRSLKVLKNKLAILMSLKTLTMN